MDQTPNLHLPYIMAAQAQKHVTHNEAIRMLDAIVQLSIADRDLTTPPAVPVEGTRYIVGPGPTGAWIGHTGHVAAYQDGAWAFYVPIEGWLAWIADEDVLVNWTGIAWAAVSGGGGGSVNPAPLVGVNTTADATNKLSVASDAVLFNHNGAGTQVKLNKAALANSASFLFQTAFSGRAEIGLTGDDDFHFKVSPDGTTFAEALILNKTTGAVTHKAGARSTFTHDAANAGVNLVPVAGDPSAPANGDLWYNATTGTFRKRQAGATSDLSSGGAGEINTASNVGTAGVGLFKQKTGVNLEFKKISAGNAAITITDDTVDSEVDVAIATNGVGNTLLAQMAANTLKGNNTGAAANAADLTAAQVKTLLAIASADISGLAAIATSGSASNLVAGTVPAAQMPAHTGDVTSTAGSLGLTIAANAVSNTKLADMATATFKGRAAAGTGDPEDLTAMQATSLLNVMVGDTGTGGTKGLVPAPVAGDASKFLRGDGAFVAIPGGGDALVANPLSQFAATSSLQLQGVISDETGSGALVFATSPSLVTPVLGTPASGDLLNCTGSTDLAKGVVELATDAEAIAGADAVRAMTPANAKAARRLLQSKYAEYTANVAMTVIIPVDDTIPQITEGTEIMTLAITPTSTTSRLRVEFRGQGSTSVALFMVAALFRDAIANALTATTQVCGVANQPNSLVLVHEFVPASLTPITFRIRVGANAAGTMRMNGSSAARYFGGVSKVTLVVQEFAA